MKAYSLLIGFAVVFSTLTAGAAVMTISSNPGQDVTAKFTFGTVDVGPGNGSFTFETGKGLIGPSSNPTDQSGFKNSAGDLFAIAVTPATKAAFVYFFLANSKSDFILVNDVNRRVARMLSQPWCEDAKGYLRVEMIHGRNVKLETIDYAHAPFKTHTFWVRVDRAGGIERLY